MFKLKNNLIKMSSNLVEKIEEKFLQLKRPIDSDDLKESKKKKPREIPVYDGEYYFDFENCLRYVYPYEFKFQAFAKKRWFGREIESVYATEFRVHSPNTLGYMFRSGKITVNGKTVKTDYKIKNGDKIQSSVHRHENPVLASKIEIIKETDDLIAINKPSSMPVHTAGKYRLNTILGILSKEYSYEDLYTVHRLDRLTSGVLIFAKSPKKAKELSEHIISRTVEKEYVCKVDGIFPEDEIICTAKLDTLCKKLGFRFVTDTGKECLTKFKRLYTDGKTSIVHCKLETGRTHQIRVHLQYLGYPISNDPFYNSYAFGPNKGKDAEYLKIKTKEKLLEDLYAEHPNNMLHGDQISFELTCQELEQSLAQGEFYDDVNFKHSEEARMNLIRNELYDERVKELETTDEQVDEFINKLSNYEMINTKIDIPYLKDNKHLKFNKDKYNVNPCCELCWMHYKKPSLDSLILYLHAMRYKIDDQTYFAEPPNWAKFSNFNYSNCKF